MGKVIVTNIPPGPWKEWERHALVVAPRRDTAGTSDPHRRPRSRQEQVRAALALSRRRHEADAFLVTADLTGLVLAAVLRSRPGQVPPVFFTATIWTRPRRAGELLARRALFRWINPVLRRVFVHTRVEIENYSTVFGIPREKFRFLPFCHRLRGYEFEVRDEGYVWSGGNGDRDYRTLVEAVRELRCRVLVNSTRSELFSGVEIPPHVEVVGVSPQEFRRAMAACRLAVIPMEGGHLHPGGQQTFLAVMAMGKPVIVTDPEGGRDYITDGEDGFLVPPGDPAALRTVLQRLLTDAELRSRIGERARQKALPLDEEHRARILLEAILDDLP